MAALISFSRLYSNQAAAEDFAGTGRFVTYPTAGHKSETEKSRTMDGFTVRRAKGDDSAEVTLIYNAGIDERVATFNTTHVATEDRREKIENGGDKYPVFVAETEGGKIAGWGRSLPIVLESATRGLERFRYTCVAIAEGKESKTHCFSP